MKKRSTFAPQGRALFENRGEVVSTILVGILILMGAGFIVGQALFFIRDKEAPPKEPERQVMMQRDQDPGQVIGTSGEGGQENLPPIQR